MGSVCARSTDRTVTAKRPNDDSQDLGQYIGVPVSRVVHYERLSLGLHMEENGLPAAVLTAATRTKSAGGTATPQQVSMTASDESFEGRRASRRVRFADEVPNMDEVLPLTLSPLDQAAASGRTLTPEHSSLASETGHLPEQVTTAAPTGFIALTVSAYTTQVPLLLQDVACAWSLYRRGRAVSASPAEEDTTEMTLSSRPPPPSRQQSELLRGQAEAAVQAFVTRRLYKKRLQQLRARWSGVYGCMPSIEPGSVLYVAVGDRVCAPVLQTAVCETSPTSASSNNGADAGAANLVRFSPSKAIALIRALLVSLPMPLMPFLCSRQLEALVTMRTLQQSEAAASPLGSDHGARLSRVAVAGRREHLDTRDGCEANTVEGDESLPPPYRTAHSGSQPSVATVLGLRTETENETTVTSLRAVADTTTTTPSVPPWTAEELHRRARRTLLEEFARVDMAGFCTYQYLLQLLVSSQDDVSVAEIKGVLEAVVRDPSPGLVRDLLRLVVGTATTTAFFADATTAAADGTRTRRRRTHSQKTERTIAEHTGAVTVPARVDATTALADTTAVDVGAEAAADAASPSPPAVETTRTRSPSVPRHHAEVDTIGGARDESDLDKHALSETAKRLEKALDDAVATTATVTSSHPPIPHDGSVAMHKADNDDAGVEAGCGDASVDAREPATGGGDRNADNAADDASDDDDDTTTSVQNRDDGRRDKVATSAPAKTAAVGARGESRSLAVHGAMQPSCSSSSSSLASSRFASDDSDGVELEAPVNTAPPSSLHPQSQAVSAPAPFSQTVDVVVDKQEGNHGHNDELLPDTARKGEHVRLKQSTVTEENEEEEDVLTPHQEWPDASFSETSDHNVTTARRQDAASSQTQNMKPPHSSSSSSCSDVADGDAAAIAVDAEAPFPPSRHAVAADDPRLSEADQEALQREQAVSTPNQHTVRALPSAAHARYSSAHSTPLSHVLADMSPVRAQGSRDESGSDDDQVWETVATAPLRPLERLPEMTRVPPTANAVNTMRPPSDDDEDEDGEGGEARDKDGMRTDDENVDDEFDVLPLTPTRVEEDAGASAAAHATAVVLKPMPDAVRQLANETQDTRHAAIVGVHSALSSAEEEKISEDEDEDRDDPKHSVAVKGPHATQSLDEQREDGPATDVVVVVHKSRPRSMGIGNDKAPVAPASTPPAGVPSDSQPPPLPVPSAATPLEDAGVNDHHVDPSASMALAPCRARAGAPTMAALLHAKQAFLTGYTQTSSRSLQETSSISTAPEAQAQSTPTSDVVKEEDEEERDIPADEANAGVSCDMVNAAALRRQRLLQEIMEHQVRRGVPASVASDTVRELTALYPSLRSVTSGRPEARAVCVDDAVDTGRGVDVQSATDAVRLLEEAASLRRDLRSLQDLSCELTAERDAQREAQTYLTQHRDTTVALVMQRCSALERQQHETDMMRRYAEARMRDLEKQLRASREHQEKLQSELVATTDASVRLRAALSSSRV